MVWFFLFLSIFVIIAGVSLAVWESRTHWASPSVGVIGSSFAFIGLIMFVISSIMVFEWKQAEVQADLLNRTYGTEFTQSELFYASDVIDIIKQMNRQRIEVNGNLFGHGVDSCAVVTK